MTSNRLTLVALLAGGLAAGCGNYSNEDLEFMNAVPAESDLSANIPPRPLSLPALSEAELAKDTHDTVKLFNGLLDTVLAGVEVLRTYQPTGRGPDSRTGSSARVPFSSMERMGTSSAGGAHLK